MDSYFDDEPNIGGAADAESDSDSDNDSTTSSENDDKKAVGEGEIEIEEDDEELEDQEDDDDEEAEEDDEDDEQIGGGEDDDEEKGDDEDIVVKSGKKIKKIPAKTIVKKAFADEMSDDEADDDDGEIYLKKFDKEINDNYILNHHPECALQNYDEILAMTKVIRDTDNIIIDDLHKTNPFLTKYERARILGQRAKQIESGATPFVKVPENMIDGYLIAELELQQGRIPFIIRRPLPNGGSEYFKIIDLENIAF